MKLFLITHNDDYQLPLFVGDSIADCACFLGISVAACYKRFRVGRSTYRSKYLYFRLDAEEKGEDHGKADTFTNALH